MTDRRIAFDLDGTLCTETNGEYEQAQPIVERILHVRRLASEGWHITIDSARGSISGNDWTDETAAQLKRWGVPYDELRVGQKPFAHRYVDNRAVAADDFFAAESGHIERWPDGYFSQRSGNDPRRQESFKREAGWLYDHRIWPSSVVCDVGCSTGEFLSVFGSHGRRYGMEISEHAKAIAKTRGISFERDIFTESEFFDVVIFRGTIQHLPHPFRYIERAYRALKPGGHIAFLATPNTDSLVYRMFGEFPPPLSDHSRNYWMPSARALANALQNFGFEVVAVEYPYWGGPYARPLHDGLSFARRLLFGQWVSFSWPGNLFNLVARKP